MWGQWWTRASPTTATRLAAAKLHVLATAPSITGRPTQVGSRVHKETQKQKQAQAATVRRQPRRRHQMARHEKATRWMPTANRAAAAIAVVDAVAANVAVMAWVQKAAPMASKL